MTPLQVLAPLGRWRWRRSTESVALQPPIEPLGDRILYQRDPDVETTEGGLHKPDVAMVKTLKGVVLAAGPGVKDLVPGDRFAFSVHGGADLPEEAFPGFERLGIIREAEVWGRLT